MPLNALKLEQVAMLDLQRQYQHIRQDVLAAVERVCSSQQFILGQEVERLEHEVAAFTGAAAAVGCASGTDALWLALAACGVKPGDSVITTPFSFLASASAIVRAGAIPVFADIDPATFNIDPNQVADKLRNNKIRAMLPVHLYGQCADMNALQRPADEFNAVLVEDAAQAIGAAWEDARQALWAGRRRSVLSHQETERLRRGGIWLQHRIPIEPTTCAGFAAMEVPAAMFTRNWAGTRAWMPFRPPSFE